MVATIVLIVILLLAGLFLFLVAPGKRRDTGKFERKAFAHRGLHDNPGGIPEKPPPRLKSPIAMKLRERLPLELLFEVLELKPSSSCRPQRPGRPL